MALTTVKSNQIQTSVALAGSPTTTTQSASDNSTKVATTAYVETAVANLVASAPSALNTLDELAAALNDDASFSTTVTNSIATKLPLAGGTLTGNLLISNSKLNVGGTTMSELLNVQTGSSSATAMVEFRNNQAGTQIGMPANTNALVLQTADTARLRIESNGNAHINHSSFSSFPTNAKFTVFGDGEVLRIDGSGNTTRKFRFRNVTDANPGVIVADGSLKLETEDSNTDIILMPIANVGIGTSSPDQLLHVYGGDAGSSYSTDGADKFILENNDSVAIDIRTPASNQALIMFSDGTRSQGLIGYNHSDDSLRFSNSGNVQRMKIDGNGRVSFGPDSLDILIDPASTNSGNNLIYLRGNASNEKSEIQLNHYGHADYHLSLIHI